jgi:nucleoid-associated protein YgaU
MWKNIQSRLQSTDAYISLALGLAVVLMVGALVINYAKNMSNTAVSTKQAEEQKAAQESAQAFPKKHVVKDGETLWSIAETYYKSGYNWVDLKKANNLADANVLTSGQELTIPEETPIVIKGQIADGVSTVAPTQTPAKPESYTVVHGDTLWNIAVKVYNDGYKWTELARVNKLENPNLIHAGNVLMIP